MNATVVETEKICREFTPRLSFPFKPPSFDLGFLQSFTKRQYPSGYNSSSFSVARALLEINEVHHWLNQLRCSNLKLTVIAAFLHASNLKGN